MKQLQNFTRKFPILMGILMIVYTWCTVQYIPSSVFGPDPLGWAIKEIVIAAVAMVLAILFIGPGFIQFTTKGWKWALRKSCYYIIVGIGLFGLISIIGIIAMVNVTQDAQFLSSFLVTLLLCIGVGFFEEVVFRVFLYGGLLARLGKSVNGIIIAALISSLCFGFIHVASTAFTSELNLDIVIQILGKTLESGIFGFLLCAIYTKTRNFMYIVVFHSVNDFLPLWMVNISDASTDYASGNSFGTYFYLILVVVLIPVIITAMKIFKSLEAPQLGPIMDDNFTAVVPND